MGNIKVVSEPSPKLMYMSTLSVAGSYPGAAPWLSNVTTAGVGQ